MLDYPASYGINKSRRVWLGLFWSREVLGLYLIFQTVHDSNFTTFNNNDNQSIPPTRRSYWGRE